MNANEKALEDILKDGLSADRLLLQKTTEILTKMAKANLAQFLTSLGEILYSEAKDKKIRQLAAIVFKNVLTRDADNTETYLKKITPEAKKNIRELVLGSLASGIKEIRTISSHLIAAICKIEQPIKANWPELLPDSSDCPAVSAGISRDKIIVDPGVAGILEAFAIGRTGIGGSAFGKHALDGFIVFLALLLLGGVVVFLVLDLVVDFGGVRVDLIGVAGTEVPDIAIKTDEGAGGEGEVGIEMADAV